MLSFSDLWEQNQSFEENSELFSWSQFNFKKTFVIQNSLKNQSKEVFETLCRFFSNDEFEIQFLNEFSALEVHPDEINIFCISIEKLQQDEFVKNLKRHSQSLIILDTTSYSDLRVDKIQSIGEEMPLFVKVDSNFDFERLYLFVTPFMQWRCSQIFSAFWEEAYRQLKTINRATKKVVNNYLSAKTNDEKVDLFFLKCWEKVERLSERIILCQSRDELATLLREFCLEGQFFDEIEIVKTLSLPNLREYKKDKKLKVVPVKSSGESLEFVVFKYSILEDFDISAFLSFSVLRIIERYNKRSLRLQELASSPWLLKESFSKLPIPIALMNSAGELVLHNQLFTQLNLGPQRCASLHNGDKIDVQDRPYLVHKSEFRDEEECFMYYSFTLASFESERSLSSNSSSELGIISSSVAHELNNPIAGLLAGIAVLQLESDLDLETRECLEEMRQGARRCKQLIETFLGFSKASPESGVYGRAFEAFEQGLNLTRFRIIESGIRFDWEVVPIENEVHLQKEVSVSVFSMVFYLIFGELITSYSHFKLVTMTQKGKHGVIKGRFIEEPECLIIRLTTHLDLGPHFCDSRLIKHLLSIEGFEMCVNNSDIILKMKVPNDV